MYFLQDIQKNKKTIMLKIKNLTVEFNGKAVLNNFSLEVKKGETVVIIGPSGTGKSTLLRCINYLEKPKKGTIELGGVYADFSKINKETIFIFTVKLLKRLKD